MITRHNVMKLSESYMDLCELPQLPKTVFRNEANLVIILLHSDIYNNDNFLTVQVKHSLVTGSLILKLMSKDV